MLRTFTSLKIKNMTVKNRIMRSATMENMADEDGFVTEEMLNLMSAGYSKRAGKVYGI